MKPLPIRLRWFGWIPTRIELAVLRFDFRQMLRGRCNDCPRNLVGRGGYTHWRCGLRRGHGELHRFINYTWGDDPSEPVAYDPVPVHIRTARHESAPAFARSYGQRRRELDLARRSDDSG